MHNIVYQLFKAGGYGYVVESIGDIKPMDSSFKRLYGHSAFLDQIIDDD